LTNIFSIEAIDVRKYYGKVKALNGLSLEVLPGTVLGLLGPNGAGKTTIVNIVSTLLRSFEGTVYVGGLDVSKEPHNVRKIIGLAGQDPAVDQWHTSFENLVMVGRLYGFNLKESKLRATELLTQLDLNDSSDRIVREYSGGMRRRLDIGAAIVARPKILILDEPTTGLDPKARIEMWKSIRDLVRDGTTLLLTTQYLEEADALADNIIVIDHGKSIAEGTPSQLKSRLGQDVLEITLENSHQSSLVSSLVQNIGNKPPRINENKISIPVLNGPESLFKSLHILEENNIKIVNLSLRQPSLDEVFISLTGTDPNLNNTLNQS